MQGKKQAEIDALAEERGCDDAGSLYPRRYKDYRLLRTFGRAIATHDYQLSGRQAKFFASEYASAYQGEIETFDRDGCYEYYEMTQADLEKYLTTIV